LAGNQPTADDLRAAVVRELGRDTGWHLEAEDWEPSERLRIEALVAHKYTQAAWNRKRA
jgi:lipoate-protein ligase A